MEMRLLTTENERNDFRPSSRRRARRAGASFRDGGCTQSNNLVRLRSADLYGLFETDGDHAERMTAGVVMHDLETFPQSCESPI